MFSSSLTESHSPTAPVTATNGPTITDKCDRPNPSGATTDRRNQSKSKASQVKSSQVKSSQDILYSRRKMWAPHVNNNRQQININISPFTFPPFPACELRRTRAHPPPPSPTHTYTHTHARTHARTKQIQIAQSIARRPRAAVVGHSSCTPRTPACHRGSALRNVLGIH